MLLCCGEDTRCTASNTSLSAMKLALEAADGVYKATDAGDLIQRSQLQRYTTRVLAVVRGDHVLCVCETSPASHYLSRQRMAWIVTGR